jgi:menaquinol-cytochrome c reductase iron-sulfur subunit
MSDSEPKDDEASDRRELPSTIPAEEEPRRVFLKVIGIGGLGAGLAAIAGAPAIPYVAYPLLHETVSSAAGFLPIGKASEFVPGKPVKVDVFADKRDAWNRVVQVKVGSAWILNEQGKIRAFSTVCPHLGCAVDYETDSKKFQCPCHRSAFTVDGKVLGGPSPRALDELEVEHEGDVVAVRYQRFRQGIAEKEAVS